MESQIEKDHEMEATMFKYVYIYIYIRIYVDICRGLHKIVWDVGI